MSFDIEELKRKINYRSNYRVNKEMDVILNSFVKTIIDNLNKNDLQNLLDLINIDDENLYNFKNGINTNKNIKDNRITKLFKEYEYRK